jgi:DNA-binding NtrC family response regulator
VLLFGPLPNSDFTKENFKGSSVSVAQERPLVKKRGRTMMADILIVDDDSVIRETLYELLSEKYQCTAAATGNEALGLLRHKRFDVVLTDLSMPGLCGSELLKRIVAEFPGTPVIMISGLSDQEQAEELSKSGVYDYLLKPFRLEAVEESVARAISSQQK